MNDNAIAAVGTVGTPYTVRGIVAYKYGRGIAGVTVKAFNINLRSEDLLGESVSDGLGHYNIQYETAFLQARKKASPDLQLRVFKKTTSADGFLKEELIWQSPVQRAAAALVKFNMAIPGHDDEVWSEYDGLHEEVSALLDPGITVAMLEETPEHQDVTALSRQLCVPRERVQALILSARLEQAPHLRAPFFYGLIRSGLPSTLEGLWALPPTAITQALEKAFSKVLIPWSLKAHADQFVKSLYAQIQIHLAAAKDTDKQGLWPILAKADVPPQARAGFLSKYLHHTGTPEEFWQDLAGNALLAPHAAAIKHCLAIGSLVGNDARLLAATLADPQASEIANFGRWRFSDWSRAVARAHTTLDSFPPGVMGQTVAERVKAYARRLSSVVPQLLGDLDTLARAQDPTERFGAIEQETKNFFKQLSSSNPGVVFAQANLRALAQKPGDLLGTSEKTLADATRLQGLLKVGKNAATVDALINSKHLSVSALAFQRFASLRPQLPPHMSDAESRAVHGEATRIAAGAMILLGELSSWANQVPLYSVASPCADQAALGDWAPFFSGRDLVACEHWRSVLSPSAYLVEALEFLANKIQGVEHGGWPTALDVLLARRPGLTQIEFSEANTNVEIPYIDVVLEVLSEAVAPFPKGLILQGVSAPTMQAAVSDINAIRSAWDRVSAGSNGLDDPLADDASVQGFADGSTWTLKNRSVRYVLRLDGPAVRITGRAFQTNRAKKVRTGSSNAVVGEGASAIRRFSTTAVNALETGRGGLLMPFDTWNAVVSGHLQQLGVRRDELMSAFQEWITCDGGGAQAPEVFRADVTAMQRVGFTLPEWKSLAIYGDQSQSIDSLALSLWGCSNASIASLSKVSFLLAHAQLTIAELEALLDCESINPGDLAQIDTSLTEFELKPFSAELVLRLLDFVRIWRKLGWRIDQVDRLLLGLAPTTERGLFEFDGASARHLAAILDVRDELDADVDTALDICLPITTTGATSDFQRLFGSSIQGKNSLGWNAQTCQLDGPGSWAEWADAQGVIRGALSLRQADLDRLIDFTKVFGGRLMPSAQPPKIEGKFAQPGSPAVLLKYGRRYAYSYATQKLDGNGQVLKEWVSLPSPLSIHSGTVTLQYPASSKTVLEVSAFAAPKSASVTHIVIWATKDSSPADAAGLYRAATIPIGQLVWRDTISDVVLEQALCARELPPDALTLESLSAMRRSVALANAFDWEVAEVIRLLRLHGSNPMARKDVLGTKHLVELACEIVEAGWTPKELEGFLGEVNEADDAYPGDATVAAQLLALKAAGQSVASSSDHSYTEEDVRKQLVNLGWPAVQIDPVLRALNCDPDTVSPSFVVELHDVELPILPLSYDGASSSHLASTEPIKALLASKLSFEPRGHGVPELGTLIIQGPLTHEEATELESVIWHGCSDKLLAQKWIEEIRSLDHDALLNRLASSLRPSFHTTFLDRWPTDLARDDSKLSGIQYDELSGSLGWRGALPRNIANDLRALSEDKYWRAAIDALFLSSSGSTSCPNNTLLKGRVHQFLMRNTAATDRLTSFGRLLARHQAHLDRTRALAAYFGEACGVAEDLVEELLQHHLRKDETTGMSLVESFLEGNFLRAPDLQVQPSKFPRQFRASRLVSKCLQLVNRLNLDILALKSLRSGPRLVGLLDFNALPVHVGDAPLGISGWREFVRFCEIANQINGGWPCMIRLAAIKEASGHQAFLSRLSEVQKWRSSQDLELASDLLMIPATAAPLSLQGRQTMRYSMAWRRLLRCMALLTQLGVTAPRAQAWVQLKLNRDAASAAVEAVQARYKPSLWRELEARLLEPVKESFRAALVAHLLMARDENGKQRWKDTSELCGHFLIDVEMGSVTTTSRIREAMSAVQLFVQRCFLGLEVRNGVVVTDAWHAWEPMRRYRVWEASRRIFLTPEAWLEPELRDGKTPLFEAFEAEMLQNELSDDCIEDAIDNYLNGLREIADLHLCAVLEEENDPSEGRHSKITHVFGRTRGTPVRYYHRQRFEGAKWGPWRRIDLDIDADQIIPVIWNRRLHLFWPVFTDSGDPPVWKIQMAHSDFSRNRWSARRVTAGHFLSDIPVGPDREASKLQHYFRTKSDGDALSIFWQSYLQSTFSRTDVSSGDAYSYLVKDSLGRIGEFEYSNCSDEARLYRHLWKVSIWTESAGQVTIAGEELGELRRQEDLRFYTIGSPPIWPHHVYGTRLEGMGLVEDGSRSAFMRQSASKRTDVILLANTPGRLPYRWVMPPRHVDQSELQPLLWQDDGHSFLVSPSLVPVDLTSRIRHPDIAGIDWVVRNYLLDFHVQPFEQEALGQLKALPSAKWSNLIKLTSPATKRSELNASPAASSTALTRTSIVQSCQSARGVLASLHLPDAKVINTSEVAAAPATEIPGARQLSDLKVPPVRVKLAAMSEFPLALRQWHTRMNKWQPAGLSLQWGYQPVLPGPLAELSYRFEPIHHPNVCSFISALKRDGLDGLYNPALQAKQEAQDWFQERYHSTDMVAKPLPRQGVDFSYCGAMSEYNFELFLEVPLLVAIRLSQSQKFEAARKWFHRIFNPLDRSPLPAPQRFWQCAPLRRVSDSNYVLDRLKELADAASSGHGSAEFEYQLRDLIEQPFNPHVVARMRLFAYQRAVVMRYVQNLIDWGDSLFRQDTVEAINEATSLYLLANDVLGPKPVIAHEEREQSLGTYDTRGSIKTSLAQKLDALAALMPMTSQALLGNDERRESFLGSSLLLFGFPPNDMMLGVWDSIQDRLFKIRNSQNIEGVQRKLALFDPPIDPAILVRAAAAGLDLSQVLSDMYAPRPHYRFDSVMLLAKELINDVKAFGAALLSAMEKRDAEKLALLRSQHEIELLDQVKEIKLRQVKEAKIQLEGLERSRKVTEQRRNYYRDIKRVSEKEARSLDLARAANIIGQLGSALQVGVSIASAIPQVHAQAMVPGTSLGGINAGPALQAAVQLLQMGASQCQFESGRYATTAGHDRRWDDWKLQERLANGELSQLDKQIAAAEIRLAISERELANHDLQMSNTRDVDEFMRTKFTNRQLYDWMVGQLSSLHYQAYLLAYDWAKKAERCYQYELCDDSTRLVTFGAWDANKKGLLAGERLERSLRKLEASYRDKNKRDFEVRKNVSLSRIDPMALAQLREKGEAFIFLSETLFDADHPGHYCRKLKSVSVSLPAVVGPYAGVQGKLTLLSNYVRISNRLGGDYQAAVSEDVLEDLRFRCDFGGIQSIAISHGNNDSGLFETNLRDERYLPFEGAGAISHWHLELPQDSNGFDLSTIGDVILHLNYTARDGGDAFAAEVRKYLHKAPTTATVDDEAGELNSLLISQAAARQASYLFSLRHEFPAVWAVLQGGGSCAMPLADIQIPRDLTSDRERPGTNKLIEVRAFLDYTFGTPEVFSGNKVEGNSATNPLPKFFFGASRVPTGEDPLGWTGMEYSPTEDVVLAVPSLMGISDDEMEEGRWVVGLQLANQFVKNPLKDVFLVMTYERK